MSDWLIWFYDVLSGCCKERVEENKKYNWTEKDFNMCLTGIVLYIESK